MEALIDKYANEIKSVIDILSSMKQGPMNTYDTKRNDFITTWTKLHNHTNAYKIYDSYYNHNHEKIKKNDMPSPILCFMKKYLKNIREGNIGFYKLTNLMEVYFNNNCSSADIEKLKLTIDCYVFIIKCPLVVLNYKSIDIAMNSIPHYELLKSLHEGHNVRRIIKDIYDFMYNLKQAQDQKAERQSMIKDVRYLSQNMESISLKIEKLEKQNICETTLAELSDRINQIESKMDTDKDKIITELTNRVNDLETKLSTFEQQASCAFDEFKDDIMSKMNIHSEFVKQVEVRPVYDYQLIKSRNAMVHREFKTMYKIFGKLLQIRYTTAIAVVVE